MHITYNKPNDKCDPIFNRTLSSNRTVESASYKKSKSPDNPAPL